MMKIRKSGWLSVVCVFLIATATLFGCSSPEANSTPDNSSITQTSQPASSGSVNMDNYKPRLDGTAVVEMIIKGKPVTIEIDGNAAPVTAGNFVDLVERGFYNGLTFHRVVTEPQPFV
ncbi:MAG: peptidylprolyl isomerase, partial [Microcystis panniformis]